MLTQDCLRHAFLLNCLSYSNSFFGKIKLTYLLSQPIPENRFKGYLPQWQCIICLFSVQLFKERQKMSRFHVL